MAINSMAVEHSVGSHSANEHLFIALHCEHVKDFGVGHQCILVGLDLTCIFKTRFGSLYMSDTHLPFCGAAFTSRIRFRSYLNAYCLAWM